MKRKILSVPARYILAVVALILAATVFLGVVMINRSKSVMRTLIRKNMLDVSNSAAALLDGDALGALTESDVGSDAYNKIYDTLATFAKTVDIVYIYAVRQTGEGEYKFTVDPDPVDPAKFGESVVITDALVSAGKGTAAVDTAPYRDRWGNYYSAYSPVFDSKGDIAGLVGIDFGSQWYDKQVRKNTVSVLIVCFLSLLFGGLVAVILTDKFRKRFELMNKELSQLSEDVDSLTEEIVSATPEMLRSANKGKADEAASPETGKVPSNDEIEIFSDKIRHMQNELRRYIEYIHAQAYTDVSTGVGNKTAYLELVKSLNDEISQGGASFAIAVFDLNGLKKINDNCGHEYGDMIISGAAICIGAVYGASRTFRIGGDEFISVLKGETKDGVVSQFEKLNDYVEKFNRKAEVNEEKLSLSMGAAEYVPDLDQSFKTVFKRADEQMYFDKGEYYRKYGDRRKHE